MKVWQKVHALTLDIYRSTRSFPSDERYGLTAQLRRSCASISANLAEGCARAGDNDFARFVSIAAGSASETDYHLLLARDLEYLEAVSILDKRTGRQRVSADRISRGALAPGFETASRQVNLQVTLRAGL